MKVKTCRVCGNKIFRDVFSLGKQPLANNLPVSPNKKISTYPLELIKCSHCLLYQLNYVVPKEVLFDNYFYIPSVSTTHLAHFDKMSRSLIKKLPLQKNDLVVDIGGSDGSLSKAFEKQGMRVINIEPAKNIISKVYKYNAYFNKKTAYDVVKKFGHAKLITATNVFAHIDNLSEFIASLDILLAQDGVFYAQFPDVRNLFKENQFDTIYHEHLSYFTQEPLYHLFSQTPLEIFKITHAKIHGGSMTIFVRRRGNMEKTFAANVQIIKNELSTFLKKQKAQKKRIVAFGASAKGMVLLYYCNFDNTIIDYVADGTSYKQGKFTPGTNIPIKAESELLKSPPDVVLILAWNFKEEIITKVQKMLASSKKKITFVIPIPKVKIIR